MGATEVRLLSQDKNVQKRWKVDSQAKHIFDFQGLFFWREEDPRRRNNFTLGLHQGRNMVYLGPIDPYLLAVTLIPEPHFPQNFDP